MTYTRLNTDYSSDINALKEKIHTNAVNKGYIAIDNANQNIHIFTGLNSNNEWCDFSFEPTGLWMRVYTGSGTSNPKGNWKLIASWS